jgi:hypothetical protein
MTPEDAEEVCKCVENAIAHACMHIRLMALRGTIRRDPPLTPEQVAVAEACLQEWFKEEAGALASPFAALASPSDQAP